MASLHQVESLMLTLRGAHARGGGNVLEVVVDLATFRVLMRDVALEHVQVTSEPDVLIAHGVRVRRGREALDERRPLATYPAWRDK